MMKCFFPIVATATALFTIIIGSNDGLSFVSANTLRITFNNGTAQTSSTLCNTADEVEINKVLTTLSFLSLTSARRLRSRSMKVTPSVGQNETETSYDVVETSTDRKLWSAFCADVCAGYVPKTCRIAQCKGYRRSRTLEEEEAGWNGITNNMNNDRNLQSNSCSTLEWHAHAGFDRLISMGPLSSTCKTFIARSGRKVECIYNSIYGEITSLRALTTGSSPTIINNNIPATGWSISKSFNVINLQAMVNLCVLEVHFSMTSTAGASNSFSFYDSTAPFQVATWVDKPGTYTFTVTPNRIASRAKTYTFTVF